MKRLVALFFILSSATFLCLAQVQRTPEITAPELRHHLEYIASDQLEGRRTGSRGAELAADYIAKEFKRDQLIPKGDKGSYFQGFEFVDGVKLGSGNQLVAKAGMKSTEFRLEHDFTPLGFSANDTVSGGVVFAGYGISAPDQKYDDYAGVDVKGKVVMLMRYHPEGDNQHSEFNKFAGLRYKASKAKELGASAILLVTGPADADQDKLMKLTYNNEMGNAGIVALNLTREAANRLLRGTGFTLAQLQDSINQSKQPYSMVLKDVTIDATVNLIQIKKHAMNVVGLVEGSDPVLRNQYVIIGAHYDHLGWGGEGSGSLQPDTIAIHNGADDNGSGTVGVMELAQWFSAHRSELKRSVLFISFTGEELGLLGSAHFVKDPTIPLDSAIVMINMDMIGRLRDRKLIIYGIGTSPGFEKLVEQYNQDSTFVYKLNKDGYGPSDQSSFYAKKMPVLFFFTDLHEDYHRPTDDVDKINFPGMVKVLDLVKEVAMNLDDASTRPMYAEVESPRPMGGAAERSFRTYTGTIPDFGEQTEGMKISGVREGSPAANAGLQGGDIIIKLGTIDIKNIYDYTFALGQYKPGDDLELVYKRNGQTIKTRIVLGRRN